MNSSRHQIIQLIEQGVLPTEKISDALTVLKITPDGTAWRTFLNSLLLWLGGLALVFAAMFFVAYNWDEIGRFAKFGLVEGCMVVAIVSYWKWAEHPVVSKVSLLVATISLGVLLALYGQTYQTGADPWQLFFNWALLMLPWALIGRFPAIWIVWIVLINVSIVLYHQTFRSAIGLIFSSETGMLWMTFSWNMLILIVWESLVNTWSWLSERWAVRLLAVGAGIPITGLVLDAIFSQKGEMALASFVCSLWLVFMYLMYRTIRPDLFMLAGSCLSGITVILAFLAESMLRSGEEAGSFLFLAVVIISLGTGAAFWLKKLHEEWRT